MDANQLHVDQALSNVSVSFRNGAMVADRVFPEVPVAKQSDKYHVYSKHKFRADDDLRRPGSQAKEIDWKLSQDPFYCDGHALRAVVPDEWRANADSAISLDVDTTEQLTDKILLAREVNLVATLVAGMTGSSLVDLNAIKWDADANDPIKKVDADKETIMKAIGQRPNVLLLSRETFRGVRSNAKVTGRVTGATSVKDQTVTAQQLADAFEVEEVLIADAVKLTSKEGQADTMDFVWGKRALLFYRPPSAGLRTVALGYHFMWNAGIAGVGASGVKRIRDEKRSSDLIEVHKYYDQKIVAAGAGILYINAVA